ALMGVAFKGHTEVAQILLKSGANPNVTNFNGATALIFATTFSHPDIVKLLLEAGADKTIADDRGNTALDHAKMQGKKAIIELLESA
ncbi:MAG: ankyrin repeat domain-containing protein, partial [Flavobacteriaceae bacterium]|nr:ankyrin repeat domain-containing protein [Flavobacteriaceae bacterium]